MIRFIISGKGVEEFMELITGGPRWNSAVAWVGSVGQERAVARFKELQARKSGWAAIEGIDSESLRKWLRQKDHARSEEATRRSDASNAEQIRIARSAKNAAWSAAIAAIVAAIYGEIYGSQIRGLRQLYSARRATIKEAHEFFERETAPYTEFYKSYGFDGWLGYLMKAGLIKREGEFIEMTDLGDDFILYLTAMHLTDNKPF